MSSLAPCFHHALSAVRETARSALTSSRAGRVSALLLSTSLLAGAGPASAVGLVESDTEAPTASEITVSRNSADMGKGPVDVTVRVRLRDATEVRPPVLTLDRLYIDGDVAAHEGVLELMSGTTRDGVWGTRVTMPGTIPESWLASEWIVTLDRLEDTAGNVERRTYLGTVVIEDSRPSVELRAPVIVGDQSVGAVLGVDVSADPGVPALPPGVQLAYRWSASGQYIQGATQPTLTLTPELMEQYLRVEVIARAPGYAGNIAISEAVPAASHPRIIGTRPVIQGSPLVGQRLRVDTGAWEPAGRVELTYQWLADGKAIHLGNGTSLDVHPSLRGRQISVQVTGRSHRSAWTPMRTVTLASDSTPPIRVLAESEIRTFTDVPRSSSLRDAVQWLAGAGITGGYANGRFGVRDHVTRGQTAAFLYRFSPHHIYPNPRGFHDVPQGHLFYDPVMWAAANGITGGYTDGTFRPGRKVTRGELAAFLFRLSKEDFAPSGKQDFSDVPPSSNNYRAVSWLKSSGVTGGYSDGTFRPQQPVTRGETAALLHRYERLVRLR